MVSSLDRGQRADSTEFVDVVLKAMRLRGEEARGGKHQGAVMAT